MNDILGFSINGGTIGGMTMSLALAVLLGGMIGLEREIHGHPAGLRTHILVCVGSALITIVSVHLAGPDGRQGDPGRLSAQIVTGIGFLGAGAIIREGNSIKGLTTAASIWTTAAIGIAVGASPFFGGLAVIAGAIVLFTLWILNLVEDRIERLHHRARTLEIHLHSTETAAARIFARLAEQGVEVHGIQYSATGDPHVRVMLMRVHLPRDLQIAAVVDDLGKQPGIVSINI